MKPELREPLGEPASSLQRILTVGWMMLVLFGFVLIRVLGSQTFHSLHLPGKAH